MTEHVYFALREGEGGSERPGLPPYEHRDSFIASGCGSQTGKEVQETEHNPKKTQGNAIKGKNKRGQGDGVGAVAASIEMLSAPDFELT